MARFTLAGFIDQWGDTSAATPNATRHAAANDQSVIKISLGIATSRAITVALGLEPLVSQPNRQSWSGQQTRSGPRSAGEGVAGAASPASSEGGDDSNIVGSCRSFRHADPSLPRAKLWWHD